MRNTENEFLMGLWQLLVPYIGIIAISCCNSRDESQWSVVLGNGNIVVLTEHRRILVAGDTDDDTGLCKARWLAVVTSFNSELQQENNQQY